MNLTEAQHPERLIFRGVRGSHLYGTNVATSDLDIHGIYRLHPDEFVTLFGQGEQASDDKGDTLFYELRRYMTLALTANMTVLEMLWTPEDCIQVNTPVFRRLREERQLFITSKCYFSSTGYAFAQIKKAKGKNKKVNRTGDFGDDEGVKVLREWLAQGLITPEWVETRFCAPFKDYLLRNQSITPTDKTDWKAMDELLALNDEKFRHDDSINEQLILRGPTRLHYTHLINVPKWTTLGHQSEMPMRPFPIYQGRIDLTQCHVAALEHVPNTYRLYHYGPGAKGVFHDGQIVCQSIPKEDEEPRFIGLLVFNKQDYERERTEYKSYWEWMAKRNDARWVDQEQGTLDYDQKNMMHTIRLLMSVENILRHGEPIVRFTGNQRDFLMQIRTGAFSYEEMLAFAECRVEEMEALYKVTLLPHSPNTKRIAELYKELATMGW